jgi:hypothetical protein
MLQYTRSLKKGKENQNMSQSIFAALAIFATLFGEGRDASSKMSESSVTTNDNGSVSRMFVESTVATNGNMVTERKRETRTTTDADGNILETTTSEYAQSYPVGDEDLSSLASRPVPVERCREEERKDEDGFLGLKFGEEFAGTDFVYDPGEPTLYRATFKPAKALAGFDDYYVYVTPKTHRVAKVYACAREAVDPGSNWRRHYLIEALEKRYSTWARPRSWCRPLYSFDIGRARHVSACLAGATRDYETMLVAWDDEILALAADETDSIRRDARKAAAERRRHRVDDAADAF